MTMIEKLREVLQELYTPPEQHGSLQLTVRGRPEISSHIRMSDKLDVIEGCTEPADAEIELTATALEYMMANPDTLDIRVPPLVHAVKTTGLDSLIDRFEQLLKRPGPRVRAVVDRLNNRRVPPCAQVREVDTPDLTLALRAMSESWPVCFRRAIQSEVTSWDLDDFDRHFGDVALRKSPQSGRIETFSEFIDACRASDGDRVYTNGIAIPPALDQMLAFPMFESRDYSASRLWFGRSCQGLMTMLHRDFANSVLGHIQGSKTVYLYHPDQEPLLYVYPTYNAFQVGRADPVNPDLERFPLLAETTRLLVDLEPADVLIIPTGWFHCVAAPTDVLSVSRFIEDETLTRLVADNRAQPELA